MFGGFFRFCCHTPTLVGSLLFDIMPDNDDEVGDEEVTVEETVKVLFTSVFAATVKIPVFYCENVRFWFDSVE